MPEPHPLSQADVARLEALARPDRWSLEDAVFVFDACHRTGLSVVKFAALFGLCWRRVYWWRERVLGTGAAPASASPPTPSSSTPASSGPPLANSANSARGSSHLRPTVG